MDLCTIADVKRFNSYREYSSDSIPTLTDAQGMITLISNTIIESLAGINITIGAPSASLTFTVSELVSVWTDAVSINQGKERVESIQKFNEMMKMKIDDIRQNPNDYGITTKKSGMCASDWDGSDRQYKYKKGEDAW